MIPIMNLQVRGSEMKLEELLMQTIPTLTARPSALPILKSLHLFLSHPGKGSLKTTV
jgi:hypothetical protein